jgi:cytochrome oxidase assembly protein ShyY1
MAELGFGMLLLLLVVGVLIILAPLTLYQIHSRLGETNRLLRQLVEASSAPPTTVPGLAEPAAEPMFRTLG